MIRCVFLALTALILMHSAPRAAMDEVKERLVGNTSPLLRWDNVEGAPFWVGGVSLRRAEGQGLHVVKLAPGEWVRLWLPANTVLRLRSEREDRLLPATLMLTLSSGSGLEAEVRPVPSSDGRDLLLGVPLRGPQLLRVMQPVGSDGPVTLALFVARRIAPEDPVRYRDRLDFPGDDVSLYRERRWDTVRLDRFEPAKPQSLVVNGPARLMLETRLPYDEGSATWTRAYRIDALLDDQPLQAFDFETSPDILEPLRIIGSGQAVGMVQRGFLDIPAGEHHLKLEANRPVLIRILAHAGDDFLVPRLNAPEGTTLAEVATGSAWDHGAGVWAVTKDDLSRVASGATETERLARRLGHDNRWNAGLAGAALLDQVVPRKPGMPEAAYAAERLRGAFTFWRDLLPGGGPAKIRQEMGWVSVPVLLDPLEDLPRRLPPGLPTEVLLSGLTQGFFVPMSGSPLTYLLPPREAPSELRLLVDRANSKEQLTFIVQFGEEAPRRMVLSPARDLPADAYGEAAGEEALARLPREDGPSGTRSGALAQRQPTGRLIDAGVSELPLPRDVRTVRIWSATPGVTPSVAVQYRASAPHALDDDTYPDILSRLGRDQARRLFFRALTDAIKCETWLEDPEHCPSGREIVATGPSAQALLNDWIPLLRLLRARYRSEFGTVVADVTLSPQGQPIPMAEARLIAAEAEAHERRGDWSGALELWTRLADGSRGVDWRRSQLRRTGALRSLGEAYLAERLLKSLHRAPAADRELRRNVFERLLAIAIESGDTDVQLGLYAAELPHRSEPALLAGLVETLVAAGRDTMAVQLGLLLPPNTRPVALPQAALRAGWMGQFGQLVAEEPSAPRRDIWQGLAAQRAGDEEAAMGYFQAAGREGMPWAEALTRGQAIRARLGEEGQHAEDAASDWSAWWAAHPGPRIWEDAEPLITAHAGAVAIEALGRDLLARAFRAEPARPVQLRLGGPAVLRVEVRPLHQNPKGLPLDGWATLAVGGREVMVPVSRNQPSPGLTLVGTTGTPGTAVVETIAVPAGVHDVTVSPRGFVGLVRVAIERPAIPLAVLPPPDSGLPSTGTTSSDEPAAKRHRMGELIRRFESRSAGDPAALAEAARLAHENPTVPALASLWARLALQSRWERVTALDSSAGFRTVTLPVWQPEGDAMRARAALLPRLGNGEQLLQGSNDFAFALINTAPTTLEVQLAMADLPGTVLTPITVRYWLNDQPPREVRLTPNRTSANLRIRVPAGEHGLRFAIADPQSNRFVRLRFDERRDDGEVPPPVRDAERAYDVASVAEPVAFTVEGPVWLRIDELDGDGSARSSYRYVPAGWQTLRIPPTLGRTESLLRIFRLVADRTTPPPAPAPLGAAEASPKSPVTVPDTPPPLTVDLTDALPLGGQEDGTWSVAASVQRALPLVENGPGGGNTGTGLFFQLGSTYRYFDAANRLYWRGEVLGRSYFDGTQPVIGLRGRVEHELASAPITLFAEASAFAQQVGSKGLANSGTLSGGAVWKHQLDEKTYQYATLSGYVRSLSLSAADAVGQSIDPDIFSAYKANHPIGLRISYVLRHEPWVDTIWTGSITAATGQEWDLFSPAYFSAGVDWLQLLGPVIVDAGVRSTYYTARSNGPGSSIDNLLRLTVAYEGWTPSGDRWEIGASAGYRTQSKEWIGLLSFTWHFSNGRGFRDYVPGDIPFANLRSRPLFGLSNNTMGAVSASNR